MVQGLKFLSKKGFNPQNQSNRKQVWERQQASAKEQERIRKRQQQLDREREDEELARVRHGDVFGKSQAQLRFMYDAPPGMQTAKQSDDGSDGIEDGKPPGKQSREHNNDGTVDGAIGEITKVRAGDDDAAAAFRQMLAAQASGGINGDDGDHAGNDRTSASKLSFTPVLQGSTAERIMGSEKKKADSLSVSGGAGSDNPNNALSALEKSVGRKLGDGALTLQEQVERFPQLQNAPMAKGMSGTNVNVSFKPLGAQVRNIKCLACGVWGHSRGERECKLTGWDPFSMSSTARSNVSNDSSNPKSGTRPSRPDSEQQAIHGGDIKMLDDRKKKSTGEDDGDRRSKKRHIKKDHRRHKKKRKRRDDDSYDSESDSSFSSTSRSSSSSSSRSSTREDGHHRRRKSHHRDRKKRSKGSGRHGSSSSRRHGSKKRYREDSSSSSKRHRRRHDSDSD